jgi:CRP-like cAMP-binding protein
MYSNSITIISSNTEIFQSNPEVSAVPLLRPLIDHHHWAFFKQAEAYTGLQFTDQEKKLFISEAKVKKLRKRQYFLQESDACRYIGFITKGAAKTYSINERGQESILTFSMENDWLTDLESFMGGTESCYHIEALEDLEMMVLDRTQLFSLMSAIPVVAEFIRRFQTKQLIESQKRINIALSMTAEERYVHLLKVKPDYTQRFSQNLLACYLGCKPETLSRIRKQ